MTTSSGCRLVSHKVCSRFAVESVDHGDVTMLLKMADCAPCSCKSVRARPMAASVMVDLVIAPRASMGANSRSALYSVSSSAVEFIQTVIRFLSVVMGFFSQGSPVTLRATKKVKN